jgi:hypothetical protein
MAGVALSDHDAVIRDLFDEDKMQELTGDEGPIVSRIKKITEWSGDQWLLPIQYATNQSVSATFATMQSLAVFNKFKQFAIDPYEYFGRVLFSRRFLKQAKGPNAMAYVDGMENEWSGLLKTLTLERAFQFYGDGSGCRGRLTTAADPLRPTDVTTVTAYLQNPQDSVYFFVGMEVGLAAAATGGASRANSVTIAGIDPETGKLTADIRWDTITGGAAEDYIHRKGDYDLDMLGLAAWCPPTAPGAAAFEGVDRTAHVAALGGNRLTLGGLSIAEGLRTLAAQCRIYGAQSTREKSDGGMSLIVTMHTDRWTELETELHTDGIRDFVHEVGEFGFPAIRMRTPAGPVDVYGDPMCPYSYAWLLDTKTWKFRSAGKAPEIIDDDGQKILREATANQFEGRAGWIQALGCGAPGNNGCLTF